MTCGSGIQHRLVMCKNRNEMVSPEKCNGLDRPATILQCYLTPCSLIVNESNDFLLSLPIWIPSEWSKVCYIRGSKIYSNAFYLLKCDLETCTQRRTTRCINSMNGRLITMSSCSETQPQPTLERVCPTPTCVEWRVAHWNGVR